MAATNSLVEEVAQDFHLSVTTQLLEYQIEILMKRSDIPKEFLSSLAMTKIDGENATPVTDTLSPGC